MKKVHLFQGAGGILISALGLYIFFKNVNTAVLWKEICDTEIWIIAAVVLLNPMTIWIRSLRWKVMLPGEKSDSRKSGLFAVTTIGFMINNLLPARLGEAARAVMLWKRNGFTMMESVGSLLVERTIDTLIFASFFAIPVFSIDSLGSLKPYATLMMAALVLSVISLLIYSFFRVPTAKIAYRVLDLLPSKVKLRVEKTGKELVSNLEWAFSWKRIAKVMVYSILMMFCYVFMIYFLARGIDSFDILDSMFGVSMAALGAAIPLSPGYIGTLHSSLLRGLQMVGVVENKAGAMAVLYHAIGYITITALGLIFLVNMKITLKEISKAKEQLKKE
ncbi:MAG TPA: lysylphosphatidylglycerol synthase transmembrane domain-containing protein [Chitinispirillaceae bacterium]|nr:lysylphosphatidylglycerol synthase transmembrane domain-containing protein [Chitinispirillaceae bacterium]